MWKFDYKFGTMIEIPRAALTAGEIASVAEFFSFGTNDLTQMTFGYSRDDAERNFLVTYIEEGILPVNPFQSVDQDGVGRLMKMSVDEGRAVRPNLEVGICGEHGGDPASIDFCHRIGPELCELLANSVSPWHAWQLPMQPSSTPLKNNLTPISRTKTAACRGFRIFNPDCYLA